MLTCLLLDKIFQNEIMFSQHSAVRLKEANSFYMNYLHASKVDYKTKAVEKSQVTFIFFLVLFYAFQVVLN